VMLGGSFSGFSKRPLTSMFHSTSYPIRGNEQDTSVAGGYWINLVSALGRGAYIISTIIFIRASLRFPRVGVIL
jgi:hypothetical protein